MKTALQVVFRDIPPSPAIEAEIRRRAAKLEQAADLMSCRVTLCSSGRHKHQGVMREVHVDLKLPGTEIAVTRHHAEDLYVAMRDAFDAVRRQVDEYRRRIQGEVKTHAMPLRGRVVRLSGDGFGFIEDGDGREYYFARENVAGPEFDALAVGDEVQFLEAAGGDGPQAKRVTARSRAP